MVRTPSVLLLLAWLLAFASAARAVEAEPAVATAAEVREALKVFAKAAGSKRPAERSAAVRALGALLHEKVARRLVQVAAREKDPGVLCAVFESLARQGPFASKIVPPLAARLAAEAQAAATRAARGEAGVRIDPRTGEVDVDSPAGRERLSAGREQSRMLAALLACLEALGWQSPRAPPDLTPLLQDPSDEVVTAVLGWMARQRVRAALPAVLDLFRMYPTEASWETGAVVDLGGTDATAKTAWMVRFGHPDKQRARPQVFAAIQALLRELTGRAFETPADLATYLEGAEGRGGTRSHGRR